MVGFKRRFSPHARRMKALLGSVAEPNCFAMTVNAGAIPPQHWTQDREAGGGRLVGEACHFIDLLRDLAGAVITSTQVAAMGAAPGVLSVR
jgi:predicted dehydrogenase